MKPTYNQSEKWYKGNTHIHTTRSDGGRTPEEIITMYGSAGYNFIAITDHWKAYTSHEPLSKDLPLVIGGIEIDGNDAEGHYYHVVALGDVVDVPVDTVLDRTIEKLMDHNTFLILAHPHWSGNRMEDLSNYRFDAVEIYNHVAWWLNGKNLATVYWDHALRTNPVLSGIAADDAHIRPEHPGWNGGWIMAQSETLSPVSILQALRSGAFYSTTGPLFIRIEATERTVSCTTTPVKIAWLVGEAYAGDRIAANDNGTISSFTFHIPVDSALSHAKYLRLEIEDEYGKRAWSNPLFRP